MKPGTRNPKPGTLSRFAILCTAADLLDDAAVLASSQIIALAADAAAALPDEICWMPKGEHAISACTSSGKGYQGTVICDEAGARSIAASFAAVLAKGRRVYLDKQHEDAEATAWVTAFRWDPAVGIMAKIEWTSLGESLLRGKVFYSFSPAFFINQATKRVSALWAGHAAGSLVNAPAFGAAMPALIAARLAGAEKNSNPASDGPSDNSIQKNRTMKDILIKILATLAVTPPTDATEESLGQLVLASLDKLPKGGTESKAILAQLGELQALKTADATRRKADAKAAVDKAISIGAIPAKDETIQAHWLRVIEAEPSNAALLASLPGNPALTRVTTPGHELEVKDGPVEILKAYAAKTSPDDRAVIYAKDVSPLLDKPNFRLGPILAVNSLGSVAGDLVTQRSFTLLKRDYPAIFGMSTDFSGEAASFGQTVKSRLRTVPAVTPYSTETGYATSGVSTVDVDVVINAHNAVQIAFGVNELASGNRDFFGEQVEGAHSAIGADLYDAILAVITAGNFSVAQLTTICALSGFGRPTLTAMARKLTDRKVAKAGRSILLNTEYYEKLGQDTSIVSLSVHQQAGIITEGELPRVAKFQPYEVQEFPSTGNLVGFACAPDALAIATRVPDDYTKVMPDVSGGGVVQIVKNPDTGISVMLVRYIDHQMGKATWRIAYMRGAAKGQVASGERLISSDPSS